MDEKYVHRNVRLGFVMLLILLVIDRVFYFEKWSFGFWLMVSGMIISLLFIVFNFFPIFYKSKKHSEIEKLKNRIDEIEKIIDELKNNKSN